MCGNLSHDVKRCSKILSFSWSFQVCYAQVWSTSCMTYVHDPCGPLLSTCCHDEPGNCPWNLLFNHRGPQLGFSHFWFVPIFLHIHAFINTFLLSHLLMKTRQDMSLHLLVPGRIIDHKSDSSGYLLMVTAEINWINHMLICVYGNNRNALNKKSLLMPEQALRSACYFLSIPKHFLFPSK